MKRSKIKEFKIRTYKARKVAVKDMAVLVSETKKSLDELLSINPSELILDI